MAKFCAAAFPVSATAKDADREMLKCTPSRAKLGSPALSKPTRAVKLWQGYRVISRRRVKPNESRSHV